MSVVAAEISKALLRGYRRLFEQLTAASEGADQSTRAHIIMLDQTGAAVGYPNIFVKFFTLS
jgi:hypothetical protein